MVASSQTQGLGPPPIVSVGQIIDGKYRVERVIGSGGMGIVVGATHVRLEEQVAIKVLRPEAARSEDVVARFLREARASVKIKSEHVVRVLDVGTLESGLPFMVMEHLQGRDLAAEIREVRALPVTTAVDYLLQACDALSEAHAAGIVHRDLKPANLFLTRRADGSPCVKVLDFGISKILAGSDPIVTRTTAVMGSPLYMSPEQMRSARDVDPRADIWSLGVILHELLVGAPPYNADSLAQLCFVVTTEPPPPLRSLRADAPPQLEAVILRCLEKDPQNRIGSVGELAAALAPFAGAWGKMIAERIVSVAGARGQGAAPPLSAVAAGRTQAVDPSAAGPALPFASPQNATPLPHGHPLIPAPAQGGTHPPSQSFQGAQSAGTFQGAQSGGTFQGSQYTMQSAAPRSGKTAVLLIGVALAMAVGGVIAYFTLRGNSGPEASASGSSTAVSAISAASSDSASSPPSPASAAPSPAAVTSSRTDVVAGAPPAEQPPSVSPAPPATTSASASNTGKPRPAGTTTAVATAKPAVTSKPGKTAPGKGGDLELPAPERGF